MAMVRTTPDVVSSICTKVRELYDADRMKIKKDLPQVPSGLAEYFIDLVFPIADQKKIFDLYPTSMKPPRMLILGLQFKNTGTNASWNWAPVVYVQVTDCMFLPTTVIDNLPGIKKLVINGSLIQAELEEDVSALPVGVAQFTKDCAAIHSKYNDVGVKTKLAVENMRNFLKDHRTLQSALKAMPALKFYLDRWIIAELERKVEPKERKAKVAEEKKTYDVSDLITKAAINRLSL